MSQKDDPRAAAEKALALYAKATQGNVVVTREDEDAGDITYAVVRSGLTIAFVPEDTRDERDGSDAKADADFIAAAYRLLPILARAVIEGQLAPLNARCPRCHSEAGTPCNSVGPDSYARGAPLKRAHAERYAASRRATPRAIPLEEP